MDNIKNINLEKGFTLIELLMGLALLGIIIFAVTAVVNTASQANQTVLTDMNQIKQARKAIEYIMDEIHYSSQPSVDPGGQSITYNVPIYSNGTVINTTNTLMYNAGVLTLTKNNGTPIVIAGQNILRTFTITQKINYKNTAIAYYQFSMRFCYNPNDPSKDLSVTENVAPFTYQ